MVNFYELSTDNGSNEFDLFSRTTFNADETIKMLQQKVNLI